VREGGREVISSYVDEALHFPFPPVLMINFS